MVTTAPASRLAQDAGARANVVLGKGVLVGELELAGLDLLEHFDHQRNLDDAHGVHLPIGVERELFAGFQRFDVDAPGSVDAGGVPFDGSAQTLDRRGRLSKLHGE